MDISELNQKGSLFVEVTEEMSGEIEELVNDLEKGMETDVFYTAVDSVRISIVDIISLRTELKIALITGKIAWNLIPISLVAGSKKWLKMQCMINQQLEYEARKENIFI